MNGFAKTKNFLKKQIKTTPHLAIITGSGVKLFKNYKPIQAINYTELPIYKQWTVNSGQWTVNSGQWTVNSGQWTVDSGQSAVNSGQSAVDSGQQTVVKGHEGKLKLYNIKGKHILVFSGRKHLYEGLDITQVIANVRIAYDMGIKNIIATNAAGGINKKFKAGDLMLINGFINLMQPNERGVISSIAIKPKKLKTSLMNKITKTHKVKHGIYLGVTGPSYETFAEIKLFNSIGADAVGMSTIPELITAKSLGLNFAGVSIISNVWDKNHKPSHKDVLRNVTKANIKLNKLILKLIE